MYKKLLVLLMLCTAVNAANYPDRVETAASQPVTAENQEIDTIQIAPLCQLGDSIVLTAMKYLGTRYQTGRQGPHAFDCSGFTSFVYGQEGIKIGRSSRDQFREGHKVAIKDLQKGDLVFFANPGKKTRINHVGIVTDVDSTGTRFNFIHASRRGVIVDTYPDMTYYVKRYVSARRIITD
ncbi:MAG: C40 family peptidase [Clostridium sp.]|nr:C40 family peptidase [Clostridium sp.]